MIAGSFYRKAMPPADGDLARGAAKVRGAEEREQPGGVESISSAGLIVLWAQVSVIARMSGHKLSVRSFRAVMC